MAVVVAASGDGAWRARGTLLEGATATTNGSWACIGGLKPLTVVVGGTFVGTVKVFVTNKGTRPADSDNTQSQLGTNLSSPDTIATGDGYQWVKAQISAYTSGSIDVSVFAG